MSSTSTKATTDATAKIICTKQIYLFLYKGNSDSNAATVMANNEQNAFDQILVNHPRLFRRLSFSSNVKEWNGQDAQLEGPNQGYYHRISENGQSVYFSIKPAHPSSGQVIWDH